MTSKEQRSKSAKEGWETLKHLQPKAAPMWTILDILAGQTSLAWEAVKFPEAECVHRNSREPEIYDSTQAYLCLVVDSRFKHEGRLSVLRPYMCVSKGGETLYGWSGLTDGWVDHQERSVHGDPDRVVAWTPVLSTFSLHDGTSAGEKWGEE